MDSALLAELRGQLLAVLAVVDQLTAQLRCYDCRRTAAVMLPWDEPDGSIVWLGPTCHAARAAGTSRRTGTPLPLADQQGGQDRA